MTQILAEIGKLNNMLKLAGMGFLSLKLLLVIFAFAIITSLGLLIGSLYFEKNHFFVNPQKAYSNPVTTKPSFLSLEITSPDDNSLVFDKSILVTGKTSSKVPVLISADLSDFVVTSKEDGGFSSQISLNPGQNRISITAFDLSGNEKQVDRLIFYSKEKL